MTSGQEPKKSSLEIFRVSSEKYENLTAEVWFEGATILQINQDAPDGHLEVEILDGTNGLGMRTAMPLDDLIRALQRAKEGLGR